jgi:hypothetical protein
MPTMPPAIAPIGGFSTAGSDVWVSLGLGANVEAGTMEINSVKSGAR